METKVPRDLVVKKVQLDHKALEANLDSGGRVVLKVLWV